MYFRPRKISFSEAERRFLEPPDDEDEDPEKEYFAEDDINFPPDDEEPF